MAIKKTITQEDLDSNPDLVTQGVKIGDEIEIPEEGEEGYVSPEDAEAEKGEGNDTEQ